MAFKLSELLNPAPSVEPATPQLPSNSEQHPRDASLPYVETQHSTHPRPPSTIANGKLDILPPQNTGIGQVAPVEPSTPIKRGSSSPTLDQYHLSPFQTQALRQSKVSVPQLPPPTLPPIQPHYDLSPPATRPERVEKHDFAPDNLLAMTAFDRQAARTDTSPLNVRPDILPTQRDSDNGPDTFVDSKPATGYPAPEAEIAALGLAALDGVQEDNQSPAIKTEAQFASELAVVPVSKPVGRPQKMTNPKPSEGSSDKRFLCYICIKLFTRRRSVRDHIKKIHDDTNFNAARAIEVTVDPETGESVIPLAELVKTLPAHSGSQPRQNPLSHPASPASSVDTNAFATPAPVAGKKRPPPDVPPAEAMAPKKKGVAKPKPANTNKKPKTEIDTSLEAITSFRSPSGTPVSSRASKTPLLSRLQKQPTASIASSPAPSDRTSVGPVTDNDADDDIEQASAPAENPEENEAGGDNEVFCICRKGDNHTWMIGCDGGCEDWFHGKCVNIQERDGDLIDKYICPNCENRGRGQTTWKRMCRRVECRKPARVLADPPSKYCSDDCKKRFWVGMVRKSDPNALVSEDGLVVVGSNIYRKEGEKRRRRKAKEDEEYNNTANDDDSDDQEDDLKLSPSRKKRKATSPTVAKAFKGSFLDGAALSSDDEPPLPTRGGPLSVGDVKMMINQAKTVDEIRQLGQKPPTPPYTSDAEVDVGNTKMVNGVDSATQQEQRPFPYSADEHTLLERLSIKKRRLIDQLQLLQDQEKFRAMIKTRSAAIIEGMDVPKAKNVCGFDARLSWSSAEFEEWRARPAGQVALETGEIGDTDPAERSEDRMLVDGEDNNDAEEDEGGGGGGGGEAVGRQTALRRICIRNKCPRHRDWRKLLASEYKFEEEGVRRQMRKAEAEARAVRERAAMRVLCLQ